MSENLNESSNDEKSELHTTDVLALMQDGIGDALANIRRAINEGDKNGTLTPNQLQELLERRTRLNVRLDKLIDAQVAIMDDDPRVKAMTAQLSALTLATSKAAKEMKDAATAIKMATRIIGFADQALGLFTGWA